MRINVLTKGGYGSGGISLSGGVASGPIKLQGDPTQPLEASTKQYVDNKVLNLNASNFTSGTLSASRLPASTGDVTSSAGSNTLTLANSGVTAGTYTKVTVDSKGRVTSGGSLSASDIPNLDWSKITTGKPTTLAGYGITNALSTGGGTMTGALILHADPTSNTHLATKQYVDNLANNASSLIAVGNIIEYPSVTTPSGFLKCNGAQVSKTTYANLYAVIGDTYNYDDLQPGSGKPWKQQYHFNTSQTGDITGWTTGPSLPGNVVYSQAIVTNGRVYLLGGHNGSGYIATIYTAPINSDGTLGSWTTGPSLP